MTEKRATALVCDVLATDARVVERQGYALVVLEGVYRNDFLGALHATATALVDNAYAPLARVVRDISSGDSVTATVKLVSRPRDGRPQLALELLHVEA